MKKLEKEYRKYGYRFTVIQRNEHVAIAEQRMPDTGQLIAYEIFEIAVHPPLKDLPERETPPPTSEWGTKGFTATTIVEAEKLYRRLTRQVIDRNKRNTHLSPEALPISPVSSNESINTL